MRLSEILVCLRRAPHKPHKHCRSLGCTVRGPGCPRSAEDCPTPPQWPPTTTTPRRRPCHRCGASPLQQEQRSLLPLPPRRRRCPPSSARSPSCRPGYLESQRSLDAVETSQSEARAGIARLRTSLKCFDALVKERDAPPPEPVDEAPEVIPERGPHSIDDDCGTLCLSVSRGRLLLDLRALLFSTKTWMDESIGDAVWRSLFERPARAVPVATDR